MKKKTRNKDNREADQTIVLIGNTYRRNVNPVPVIAVKLLLTYMLAVGTLMSFMDMYDIPFEFGSAIAQVLLFVTAFMPVFIFIKKRYAIPVLAAGAGVIYYFSTVRSMRRVCCSRTICLFSLTADCCLHCSMCL